MTAALTAAASLVTALVVAAATYILTKRREHEADWRKLKVEHYREFLVALSGIVEGRADRAAQLRYADAVNALMLVAPVEVFEAVQAYLSEISASNPHRTGAEHDRRLNKVLAAMRSDLDPAKASSEGLSFYLLAPPREPS
jgi:hypothetical protein